MRHRRKQVKQRAIANALKKPTLDDELTELATVIAEYEHDGGIRGWLKPNWRDGWNATGLALDVHRAWAVERDIDSKQVWLGTRIHQRIANREDYYIAEEMMVSRTIANEPFARIAFRCFQVTIGHLTSGDGSIFNAIMLPAFEAYDTLGQLPKSVEQHVLHWRCLDAIGTGPDLANDINDRLRRAFTIAWKRNLFMAAYALPRAIKRDA